MNKNKPPLKIFVIVQIVFQIKLWKIKYTRIVRTRSLINPLRNWTAKNQLKNNNIKS